MFSGMTGKNTIVERNQDATIYVGGLDEKVTEGLMWELFTQVGVVAEVHMPRDRVSLNHMGYGFVQFGSEEDADYAVKIVNMIKLYGKPIKVNKAAAHAKSLDVGACIFVGNLDPEVTDKMLYDVFSAFGVIFQTPRIMMHPASGMPKGYAFVSYSSFEASDAAIEAMHGQYLCNRPITVSYSYKKDSNKGERHGSAAERLLAARNPLCHKDRPHMRFSDIPPTAPVNSHYQPEAPVARVDINPMIGMKSGIGMTPPSMGMPPSFPFQFLPPPPGMFPGWGGGIMQRPPPSTGSPNMNTLMRTPPHPPFASTPPPPPFASTPPPPRFESIPPPMPFIFPQFPPMNN